MMGRYFHDACGLARYLPGQVTSVALQRKATVQGRAFIDVEVKLDDRGRMQALEIPRGPGPGTPLELTLEP